MDKNMDVKFERPLVSIVTLNYNGRRFLKGLFDTLRQCTYPNYEVILVDNCSVDDSVEFTRQHYPEVKIHRNEQNYMYAGGNNVGLNIASGKYICLINNDVEVHPGFLEPMVEAFEKNPRMAAGQPKILSMLQRDYFEYAGASGGFIDWLGYPFTRGRILFFIEKDEGQYQDPVELFWASGACIFLRKAALEETGLLDEDFILHQEEIDLCWRIHLMGWKIYAVPQSNIWHFVGGTLDQGNPRKNYWNFRNNMFLLLKNLSLGNLILRIPLRIPLDMLALLMELFKGHLAGAMAIARAYFWIITHISTILKKRADVQSRRKIPDKQALRLVYPGSIVFEYYILGHKKFSQLSFSRRILSLNPFIESDIKKGVAV
jgi:hypothetical protein